MMEPKTRAEIIEELQRCAAPGVPCADYPRNNLSDSCMSDLMLEAARLLSNSVDGQVAVRLEDKRE